MSESRGATGENPAYRYPPGWQDSVAALPCVPFGAGETVLTEGRKSGRLLILKDGAVSIVKKGVELAKVSEPGAVFGELSALLDEPHTADVRTIQPSKFYVADANILTRDPALLIYVATLLARRLDRANRGLIEIKNEFEATIL